MSRERDPLGLVGRMVGGNHMRRVIGEGALSIVYAANNAFMGADRAVKILRPAIWSSPETIIKRWSQEARICAELRHSGIVRVYTGGYDDASGQLFLEMELLHGVSLEERCRVESGGRLDPWLGCSFIAQAAEALEAAHTAAVTHRDVKPQNLFVCDNGEVKVIDFGIAHLRGARVTAPGVRMGTPDYSAPEQLDYRRAYEVGPITDVYALGATLYRVVTGTTMFEPDPDWQVVLRRVLTTEPLDAQAVAPELPAAIAGIIRQATARQSGARFQSMRAFHTALRAALDDHARGAASTSMSTTLPALRAPAPPSPLLRLVPEASAPAAEPSLTASGEITLPEPVPAAVLLAKIEAGAQQDTVESLVAPTMMVTAARWPAAPPRRLSTRTTLLVAAAVAMVGMGAAAIYRLSAPGVVVGSNVAAAAPSAEAKRASAAATGDSAGPGHRVTSEPWPEGAANAAPATVRDAAAATRPARPAAHAGSARATAHAGGAHPAKRPSAPAAAPFEVHDGLLAPSEPGEPAGGTPAQIKAFPDGDSGK